MSYYYRHICHLKLEIPATSPLNILLALSFPTCNFNSVYSFQSHISKQGADEFQTDLLLCPFPQARAISLYFQQNYHLSIFPPVYFRFYCFSSSLLTILAISFSIFAIFFFLPRSFFNCSPFFQGLPYQLCFPALLVKFSFVFPPGVKI